MPTKPVRMSVTELAHVLDQLPGNAFVYLQTSAIGHGERVPYRGAANTHVRVSGVLSGLRLLNGNEPVVIGDRTSANLYAYVQAVEVASGGVLGVVVVLHVAPVLSVSRDQLELLEREPHAHDDLCTLLTICFPEGH